MTNEFREWMVRHRIAEVKDNVLYVIFDENEWRIKQFLQAMKEHKQILDSMEDTPDNLFEGYDPRSRGAK